MLVRLVAADQAWAGAVSRCVQDGAGVVCLLGQLRPEWVCRLAGAGIDVVCRNGPGR